MALVPHAETPRPFILSLGVVYRHLQHHLCEAARRQFEQRLLNRACRYAHCIPLEFALLASG